ncbi:MAG: DNA-binding response regulator [Acidimicrobiales bacterium]|nr:MAG: DNA-binding response regulator [Acidimicrobiales bacterium]
MGNILVVEDEPAIATAVAARLEADGHAVEMCHDGAEAVERCAELEPDLVVLDLLLPGLDGLEVCRRIQAGRRVPVVMLTARDDETDMLVGLAVGADDYITKPFSPRELVARVNAVLRRVSEEGSGPSGPDHQLGAVEIFRASRRIRVEEREVHLTPTEFDLLAQLAAAAPAVLTRQQLLVAVWGYRDGSGARTVDSHVRAVRRKLGDDVIRTVHGVGYSIGDL